MTCQGNQQLQWLQPNGRKLTNQKGRVHVEQRSKDLLLLVFDKIEKEDNGLWTCISTNHSAKRNFTLNVYGNLLLLPLINYRIKYLLTIKTFITITEYINFVNLTLLQTIVEQKNEEIFCHVTGNPKPEVIWSFNGKQVGKKRKFHFILPLFFVVVPSIVIIKKSGIKATSQKSTLNNFNKKKMSKKKRCKIKDTRES